MLHPETEIRPIGAALGAAVVATRLIPAGTLVWVNDGLDQMLSRNQVAGFPEPLRSAVKNHGYFDRGGNVVLCWDNARYVNHSCEPNSLSPGYGFDIATRDIQPGEPITNDYLTLNLECEFTCQCGAPTCRGDIHRVSAHRLVATWDSLIEAVMPRVFEVPQALWGLLTDEDREELEAIKAGIRRPRSCEWHLRVMPERMPA